MVGHRLPVVRDRHARAQAVPRRLPGQVQRLSATGSVVGYSTVKAAAAALRKAGSTDPAKVAAALSGLEVDTPFGRIQFRALDHQSTMGAYVGRTAVRDGKGVMTDWRYADGKDALPPDDVVRKLRPK